MKVIVAIAAICALSVGTPSAPSRAATAPAPTIRLENSQSYAVDNVVKAYRVPVVVGNVTKYYDITVTLGLSAAGVPTSAVVASTLTPAVTSGSVVPGTYRSGSAVCTVTNMTLTNGRIQSFFSCATGPVISTLSVASGLVDTAHPFYAELHKFGEDTRADSATYAWGLVATNAQNLNGCYFIQGFPVGAKTNGALLILSSFYSITGGFYCSSTFTRQ